MRFIWGCQYSYFGTLFPMHVTMKRSPIRCGSRGRGFRTGGEWKRNVGRYVYDAPNMEMIPARPLRAVFRSYIYMKMPLGCDTLAEGSNHGGVLELPVDCKSPVDSVAWYGDPGTHVALTRTSHHQLLSQSWR